MLRRHEDSGRGAARARPDHHHRPRAGVQPVPARAGPGPGARAVTAVEPCASQRVRRVRRAQGRPGVRPAGLGRVRARPGHAAGRGRPGRLRADRAAGLRGHRAVRARRRRVHRRREQGDVHLRRPRRPLGDAAPGGHRGRGPVGDRARPGPGRAAGQAALRRAVLPLRAAAGRALPAAAAGRHRGHRGRRPGAGRRGDRGGRRGLPGARPDRLPAGDHLARRRGVPPGLPGAAARVPGRAAAGRADPGAGRGSTRCGCSTTSAPRCARCSRTRRC